MAQAPKSVYAISPQLANSVSLCIGLAFVAQLAPLQTMPAASAADFTRAKKIFVPPTRIPRRFDSESSSTEADTYSSSSPSYDPGYTTPTTAKAGKTSGKYGLVPPPPPLTPTLLPPSLLHMPAQSAATEPAAKATQQRWSVNVQKTLKRAATSPKVASFLDQAQTKAQNLIKEGKLDQAQELLKSYVKSLPRDPAIKNEFAKVTVQRAQQLLSDQNIDAAGRMAREALSVQPQNQAAHTVLAQVLKKQGLSADQAPDRVKAAKDLLAKGKVSEAELEYNTAIKLKPSADAYVGLGDIALKNNNKDKAKAEYQKALELEPHSGAALRQMGIIRLGQSDVVGANSDLSRALVVDPNDKVASQHLIDLWQKQVTQNPQSANSHLGLARAHQLSGDLQSAQTEYKKVVEIDPNNANLPAARQSFKLALARQEAHHAMDQAHNLEAAGALQEAHAKISEAVKLCPGDSAFKMYQAQLGEKLGLNSQLTGSMDNFPKTESSNASGTAIATGLAAAGGMAATASAGLLPGLAPPVAPSFRSNSVSAGQAFNGGVAEAPPAMALDGIPKATPLPSAAHVNSMGGFLTSLRNYSLQQKAQAQKSEDAAHAALKSFTDPSSDTAAATGAPVAQSPVIASASANLASVNSLLASIGASTSGAAASPSANALGAAATSAAAALGATTPDTTAATLTSTPPMTWQSATARNLATQAKQTIKKKFTQYSSQSKPAATAVQTAAQPSLADQNKQLQAQLQAAQAQITALKAQPSQPSITAETPMASPSASMPPINQVTGAGVGGSAAEIATYNTQLPSEASAATAAALSVAPNAANASVQSILQSLPPSLTSSEGFQSALANLPNSAAALQSYASTLPPATQTALQAALKPPIATTKSSPSGAVRLELEGVKPSPMDIRLNVVLHNDQKTSLSVPSTTKAIINMKGQPQRVVKITFPSKNVPANGEMHGVIKVPGHSLSPTADLYIPNLLPGQGMDRDVHLTVPISFK